jgi:hypothetical protein
VANGQKGIDCPFVREPLVRGRRTSHETGQNRLSNGKRLAPLRPLPRPVGDERVGAVVDEVGRRDADERALEAGVEARGSLGREDRANRAR